MDEVDKGSRLDNWLSLLLLFCHKFRKSFRGDHDLFETNLRQVYPDEEQHRRSRCKASVVFIVNRVHSKTLCHSRSGWQAHPNRTGLLSPIVQVGVDLYVQSDR
jgi:hypothetical protein